MRVAGWIILLVLCVRLDAATVATLDGRRLVGERLVIEPKAGTVAIAGTVVALADCDWLEPKDGAGIMLAGASARRLGVWLIDGSWLPVTGLRPAEQDHAVAVDGAFGALTLPLTAVHGWALGPALPTGPEREDIALLDSGPLSGRVQGLVAGRLVLKSALDPQPLTLALDQVRGLRLAVTPRTPRGVRLAVTLDDAYPPLRVVPSAGGFALAVAPTVELGAALAGARLRLEGGRRVYLSELEPALVEETGAFGVVWPHQRDRNLDDTPLRLGGVRYERGLTVHSQARLGWDLGGAYTRLRALVGIADLVGDQGDCAASLLLDGREVWRKDSVRGGDKPLALDVDLTGAKKLELKVDYGARYDIADHFVLADAYLIKAK